jgi:malate dehydrogenase (oxaloacetate-decarboxylating)
MTQSTAGTAAERNAHAHRWERDVDVDGRTTLFTALRGSALLAEPLLNKGTAFSEQERAALGLRGHLPAAVETLGAQVARTYAELRAEPSSIGRYQLLRALQDENEVLFYAVLSAHVHELMPVVYTPTVGQAVEQWSALFRAPRGMFLSAHHAADIGAIVDEWPNPDVRMIVATDSSAILGIGDQGVGGMAIPVGKLALYVLGGTSPYETLPVTLDVGTDRLERIEDPQYLGLRGHRLKGEAYLAVVDAFVEAVARRYPRAIVQWEDLGKDTAFTVLERFRKRLPSFNDDVQGTGAVALAGVISACKLRGTPFTEARVVVHGAGAGGAGVASLVREGMVRAGLTKEEAARRVFVLDSKGLLVEGRPLESYKVALAQPKSAVASWKIAGAVPTLHETIVHARATVLIGLSGQAGAFDEEAVRAVARNCERPIVFPLSNPTSACEALPEDVFAWTAGRAIVATGSPFPPVQVGDEARVIGQGNNAFIFPGLGFGARLAEVREITDGMVLAATDALVAWVDARHLANGQVYPPVTELGEVSAEVAAAVITQARAEGVARAELPADAELLEYVRRRAWTPEYAPVMTKGR